MNKARRLMVWIVTVWISFFTGAIAETNALPIDFSPGHVPLEEGYASPSKYQDDSIRVVIEEDRADGTSIWVARIKIAHPSQLRTVSANGFDSNQVTAGTALAKRVNAVLAINGDYFSFINNGYLIRQGDLYRNLPDGTRDVLLIDKNGDFHIALNATEESLQAFSNITVINSFNFGPALVVNGKRVEEYSDNGNAAFKPRQRMCLAQTGPLEYLCIATGGPARHSKGMTLDAFSRLVCRYGVENAYNLDGGDSTMMIFHGEKINDAQNPNTRNISDIVYFASINDSEDQPDEQ